MANGAQVENVSFVEVGWGFHGVPAGSCVFRMLRWMMLKKVLGDVAS
jgi:hypothetical protein